MSSTYFLSYSTLVYKSQHFLKMGDTEIQELKKARTKAKTNFTVSLKKLKGMIVLDTEEPILKKQVELLETSYDNLLGIHLEYVEASEGNEDEEAYIKDSTEEYYKVLGTYQNIVKANTSIKNQKEANSLANSFRINVERSFLKLTSSIDRLCSEKPEEKGLATLEEDKLILEDNLQCLLDSITKLSFYDDVGEHSKEVNRLVLQCEGVKRNINISIRECKANLHPTSVNTVITNPVSSEFQPQDNSFSASDSNLHPTSVNTVISNPVSSEFQPQGNYSFSASDSNLHPTSVNTVITNPVSSEFQPQGNYSFSAFDSNLHPTSLMTSAVSAQFQPQGSFHIASGSYTTPVSSQFQGNPSSFAFEGNPVPNSVSTNTSHFHHFNPFSDSLVGSSFQAPLMATRIPQSTIGMPFQGNTAFDHHSTVRTKKPSLPMFSGNRADWPEFKCLWRSLAEAQFANKLHLAMELKRCCSKGRAAERLKHILVTSESAYSEMWDRLSEEYDDPGLCVQAALNSLVSLKSVEEKDYGGLVRFVDSVEGVFNQLKELSHVDAVHMSDVDRVSCLLPRDVNMNWQRRYRELPTELRLKPFTEFVGFLKSERAVVARLAEVTPSMKRRKSQFTDTHGAGAQSFLKTGEGLPPAKQDHSKSLCVLHGPGHTAVQCKVFRGMNLKQRYNILRKNNLCFKCFGKHPRNACKASPCKCGQHHHFLLCDQPGNNHNSQSRQGDEKNSQSQKGNAGNSQRPNDSSQTLVSVANGGEEKPIPVSSSTCCSNGSRAFYPVHVAYLKGDKAPVAVFMDGGSNASYVTESCAKRHRLKKISNVSLSISTVGGNKKDHSSSVYEVPLVTHDRKVVTIEAYSLPKITNPAPPVRGEDLESLFPDYEVSSLVRPSTEVDVLLGADWFGLHPKLEVAKCGDNLSIMKGSLGVCLVGSHPHLVNSSFEESALSEVDSVETHLTQSHPALSQPFSFIVGEELGTESTPRCGNCKCGKCPLPGHSLSFREEQELHMIRSNLEHDKEKRLWVTSYPWLFDPYTLPNNFSSAFSTLKSIERRLMKDPEWAKSYDGQIKEMLDRGVARKLSEAEIKEWQGPFFYISHLAVVNDKSKSTPVRIVFNSSQVCQGKSLNSCLAKGPDSYRNSGLGILLRWREESVALVGDIRKMFHSVHLRPIEQHCHRFLWRELDESKDPDIYIMERVNMGDRPAPAIATEALIMTAESYKEVYPRAARFVEESSYVDDLADSVESKKLAEELAQDTELLLAEGNFHVKEWQFSGSGKSESASLKGEGENIGVLGTQWNPVKDTLSFQVTLNFSKKKRGVRSQPNIKREEVSLNIPETLTKRLVLQQVMSIYDPMGLASPFTLLGKIYLRETWLLGLGWDDPIPPVLHQKWKNFFESLFELEDLSFPRCMRPANAVGNPWLILLSDGSDVAYGCAAYIRWHCSDGSVVVRLMMAKSRIAPINKVSTPRMELNGAVISKRCRVVIQKESRYEFDKIIHLLDSETVLNQLNKISTRFNPYEGVRVGEIQASTNGNMSEWAWMSGKENTSDLLTRGCTPDQLQATSEWFQGPPMIYLPFEEWAIKFGKTSEEKVPGEKKFHGVHTHTAVGKPIQCLLNYDNISSLSNATGVIARLIGIARKKSFKGGRLTNLNPRLRAEAEKFLVTDAQRAVDMESDNYKRLNPARKEDGVWVVGASRLANNNPMRGIHASLPVFLPSGHSLAKLAMKAAHDRAHRGRDATLAAFRERFWTPSGSKLAKSIVNQCQLCKLRNATLMKQVMGSLPIERTAPAPPFNFTMLDLFGPYRVRGEVQKRVSGKVWGVLFTDMVSRAVHIEVMCGYDTDSFLLALRRFTSVRGWPQKLYSDPGSQLVGAKNLMEAMCGFGSENGLEWNLGTPDSPWQQGAVESLVKSVKRALDVSVHNQRLSVPEFITVCSEAANLVNERPLGLLPSLDSNINVLTPNCMLLGRATSVNPNVWQTDNFSMKDRSRLVSSITDQFWMHWLELFAPTLVYRQKWHEKQRDLKVGDVVLVLDNETFKGKYKLAIVTDILPSRDGRVRKVVVSYKTFKTGEKVHEYKGQLHTSVQRSCQKLVLLVPVDE